jgi:hypothetical protein
MRQTPSQDLIILLYASWLAQHSTRSIKLHEAQDPDRIWTQNRGSCRSHLDEPCPIHENPKHRARQCRVLKKLRQPLTVAHRRQMNRDPSLDRLVFQIVRTTISRIIRDPRL